MWSDSVISQWVLENISENTGIAQIAKVLSQITSWGQLWICIMIVLMVLEYLRNKKIQVFYLLALIPVLAGWCLCEYWLKDAVGRARPFEEIEGFAELMDAIGYDRPSGASFPSGHTLIAFASAFILAHHNRKLLPYGYILATLIACSRLILGAHYFSDVLSGAGLGTLIGVLSCLFADALSPKLLRMLPKAKKESPHAP